MPERDSTLPSSIPPAWLVGLLEKQAVFERNVHSCYIQVVKKGPVT